MHIVRRRRWIRREKKERSCKDSRIYCTTFKLLISLERKIIVILRKLQAYPSTTGRNSWNCAGIGRNTPLLGEDLLGQNNEISNFCRHSSYYLPVAQKHKLHSVLTRFTRRGGGGCYYIITVCSGPQPLCSYRIYVFCTWIGVSEVVRRVQLQSHSAEAPSKRVLFCAGTQTPLNISRRRWMMIPLW
jgi:hypothetical protein